MASVQRDPGNIDDPVLVKRDRFTGCRRGAAGELLFRVSFDEQSRFIESVPYGFWTVAECAVYIKELTRLFDICRGRFGSCRLLIDRRACPVQRPEIISEITKFNAKIKSGDKIAVVVGSNLSRLQITRAGLALETKIFLSYDDGKSWLMS